MRPWRQESRKLRDGSLAWFVLKTDGRDESVDVVIDGEVQFSSGSWSSSSDAIKCAERMLVLRDEKAANSNCDVAEEIETINAHRAKKAKLIVTYDHHDAKFAIIAGYPPYKWIDTGIRRAIENDARSLLKCE